MKGGKEEAGKKSLNISVSNKEQQHHQLFHALFRFVLTTESILLLLYNKLPRRTQKRFRYIHAYIYACMHVQI
jgi:hypothetical protein